MRHLKEKTHDSAPRPSELQKLPAEYSMVRIIFIIFIVSLIATAFMIRG